MDVPISTAQAAYGGGEYVHQIMFTIADAGLEQSERAVEADRAPDANGAVARVLRGIGRAATAPVRGIVWLVRLMPELLRFWFSGLASFVGTLARPLLVAFDRGFARFVDGYHAVLEWALDRFEEAGLELPPFVMTFHDGAGPCHGNTGWYQQRGGVAHIEICSPTNHIILHELAHAWEGASVSQDVRDDFASHWSVDNWNDHEAAWADRGTERAADTIAYVLAGVPDEPTDQLMRFVCGYSLLTGMELPEDQTADCGVE